MYRLIDQDSGAFSYWVIKEATKEELGPLFGQAPGNGPPGFVLESLPWQAQQFVIQHELYHFVDRGYKKGPIGTLLMELRANLFGAVQFPWGFAIVVFLSFTPTRLKYYAKKFWGGFLNTFWGKS
jgi:hypothetical protein